MRPLRLVERGRTVHYDEGVLTEERSSPFPAEAGHLLVVEALKLATNRERPNEGNGQGGFWPHGTRSYELDGSFPSGHAAESFPLARVIASEYPSKPVQMAAYAFALAISASRVTARNPAGHRAAGLRLAFFQRKIVVREKLL